VNKVEKNTIYLKQNSFVTHFYCHLLNEFLSKIKI